MLADVFSRGRTGAQMQDLLDAANITANKNTIPNETQSVRVTSGVRLGTPAVTTRGMGEEEMRRDRARSSAVWSMRARTPLRPCGRRCSICARASRSIRICRRKLQSGPQTPLSKSNTF